MKKRHIGSLEVSEVGIGCNLFGAAIDADGTKAVVDAALDQGINFFDTSNTYGGTPDKGGFESERLLGLALRGRRDGVVIATKFGMGIDNNPDLLWSADPSFIRSACEGSLRRLGVEHIDLYQLHVPDAATPLEDTVATLQSLVAEGKIREFGCSNFTGELLHQAHTAAKGGRAMVSVQNQYSLLAREPEASVLPACDELSMGFLPYYPLFKGVLTDGFDPFAPLESQTLYSSMPEGRRAYFFSEENLSKAQRVHQLARDHGLSVVTLAFSWLLSHPEVRSVIAGVSKPSRIADNVAAATELSPELRAELDALTA